MRSLLFKGIVVLGFSVFIRPMASAQFMGGGYWGSGMSGAIGGCGYKVDVGPDAKATLEDMKDLKKKLKQDDRDLRDAQKADSEAREALRKANREFSGLYVHNSRVVRFALNGLGVIDSRVTKKGTGFACADVFEISDSKTVSGTTSTTTAGTTTTASASSTTPKLKKSIEPLNPDDYYRACKSIGSGEMDGDTFCHISIVNKTSKNGKDANDERKENWDANCSGNFDALSQAAKDAREKADALAQAKKVKDDDIKEFEALNDKGSKEVEDYLEQKREDAEASTSESGICLACMLAANGAVYQRPEPNLPLVGANLALGLGAMYLGNQLNKYDANQNAKLGFATQPVPSFGYAWPFIMGAFYGAVGGGGTAGGSFGCGSSMSGGGYSMGPYGMSSPYGLAGMYGPSGGAFGYPANMYPSAMSGGTFLPGMSPWGMNGPWGLNGGNGMGGFMSPYGNMFAGGPAPFGVGGYVNPYSGGLDGGNFGGSPWGGGGGGFP